MITDYMLKHNDITNLSQEDRKLLSQQLLACCEIDPERADACWIWQGPVDHRGFGRLRLSIHPLIQPKNYLWYSTHRLAYMLYNDKIPEKHVVRRTCGDSSCCNPKHLIALQIGGLYDRNYLY